MALDDLIADLLLTVVLGGPPLLIVLFVLVLRQARVQDKRWEEQLEAMTEAPSIESFQAAPPEIGGLSVAEYTPQQYLKLSTEREDTSMAFSSRVFMGGGLVLGGLMVGKAVWIRMEDAAAKTIGLFMALVLVGAGIFVLFYRSLAPVQSVAFDGRHRRVELGHGDNISASSFVDFSAILMRESGLVRQVPSAPLGMSWRIELVRQARRNVPVTISAARYDREAGFENSAVLAKAIAVIMRVPIRVRSSRWSSSRLREL